MTIRITKHDGTFVTNVFATYENLSEKIEYCKSKYSPQEYHADLITY
jgi:hypothetical protein